MGDVIQLRPRSYTAKPFRAETVYGVFHVSGTLCGHIDVALPQGKTLALSPNEVLALVQALQGAREDVVNNSRPFDDPRLIE
jgi:hypothetical protein